MSRRGLFFVILIFVGCIAGALFSIKRHRVKEQQKLLSEHVAQIKAKDLSEVITPDMIDEMIIINPAGQFRLQRDENGDWWLVEPVKSRANPNNVNHLPLVLVGMKIEGRVEKNPKNLAIYGLDNPDLVVKYKTTDNPRWHELAFGRRSPIAGNYYAMDADEREVLLVPYGDKFEFFNELNDFRDTRIFPFDVREADRMVLKYPDKTYEFEKDNNFVFWRIIRPFIGLASENIGFMLINLDRLRFGGAVVNADVKKAGFDSPELVISVHHPRLGTSELVIGKIKEGYFHYAMLVGGKDIFLVHRDAYENETISNFVKKPGRNSAFYFPFKSLQKIRFEKNGQVLEMYRPDGHPDWQIKGLEGKEIDEAKLETVLLSLLGFSNGGYIGVMADPASAQYGFDKPSAVIHMMPQPGKTISEREVFFGKPDRSGKNVYLYTDADPIIRLVSRDAIGLITVNPMDFVFPTPTTPK